MLTTTHNTQTIAKALKTVRSAGPRTDRAKEVARANSLKHGLQGSEIAVQIEDADQIKSFFRDLHAEMCPQTILGSIFAKQVALSSVRLDRAARHEAANLRHKLRHAETNYDEAKRGDADHLLGWIAAEPVAYRRNLLATPQGIDCLIKALSNLREDVIYEPHLWDVNQEMKLEAYFGRRSDDVPYSRGRRLSRAIQCDLSMLSPEEAEQAKAKGSRAWSIEQMLIYLDAEIQYLTDHRNNFDHAQLALDRAEAIERAAVDVGKEALLAKKAEAATKRDLHRSLKEYRIVEGRGSLPALMEGNEPAKATLNADIAVEIEPDEFLTAQAQPTIDAKPLPGNDLGAKLGSFGTTAPPDQEPSDQASQVAAPSGETLEAGQPTSLESVPEPDQRE